MVDEVIPKDPNETWETCPLSTLLNRIQRLTHALRFCRGRAADLYPHTFLERSRLIDIYTRRIIKRDYPSE
jgi:hypothetical protein